jgi:hypothetical protein
MTAHSRDNRRTGADPARRSDSHLTERIYPPPNISRTSPSPDPPSVSAGPAVSPPFAAGPGAAGAQVLYYILCGHHADAATGTRIGWVPAGAWVRHVVAHCTECTRKQGPPRRIPERPFEELPW